MAILCQVCSCKYFGDSDKKIYGICHHPIGRGYTGIARSPICGLYEPKEIISVDLSEEEVTLENEIL